MKKTTIALATTLLLLSGCASEDPPVDEAGRSATANEEPGSRGDDKKEKGDKGKQRKPGEESREEASAGGGDAAGDDGSEDGNGGGSTDGGSGASKSGGGGGAAPYPAAGTYSYAQSGYEEFCDSAGRCEKEKLPARQPVSLSYEKRSGSTATVVTEQQASGSRVARTWTKYAPSGAHITKVYVRMEYSGFRFERTYVPEPPVEAFRFPFRTGESWSGSWRASTSGSYSVEVGDAKKTEVGGRGVTAYRIDTTTEFRGDFEGKSRVTAYYDYDTKALIAADGVLNVTSQFGRYTTVFETQLTSGPGY